MFEWIMQLLDESSKPLIPDYGLSSVFYWVTVVSQET